MSLACAKTSSVLAYSLPYSKYVSLLTSWAFTGLVRSCMQSFQVSHSWSTLYFQPLSLVNMLG